jgi:hypothetical protein
MEVETFDVQDDSGTQICQKTGHRGRSGAPITVAKGADLELSSKTPARKQSDRINIGQRRQKFSLHQE